MMPHLRWPEKRSDEECVEDLRRVIARCDRWRPWLLVFSFVLIVGVLGSLVGGAQVIKMEILSGRIPKPWWGIAMGVPLGALFGLGAVSVGNVLIMVLFGLRTERLLVKYHDDACSAGQLDECEE